MDAKIYFLLILISLILYFFRPIKKDIKLTKNKKLHPIGYKLFYTDQKNITKKENVIYSKLLYSEKYNLTGKPDYIFKKGNKFLPIELKSGKIKENTPHPGDILQLIAYFLILEDLYNAKINYGKLIYCNKAFIIKNTKKNKTLVLNTLKEMRNMLKTGEGIANCNFIKCNHCICKNTVCEHYEKL